jgi:hypothetical protein
LREELEATPKFDEKSILSESLTITIHHCRT